MTLGATDTGAEHVKGCSNDLGMRCCMYYEILDGIKNLQLAEELGLVCFREYMHVNAIENKIY